MQGNFVPSQDEAEALQRVAGQVGAEVPAGKQQFVVHSGVSLSVLLRIKQLVEEWHPWAKTRDVVTNFIKPITLDPSTGRVCRFFELLPASSVRRPDYFISHMFDAHFVDVVDSIARKLANYDPSAVFLWMDIFAVNQHSLESDLELLHACLFATRHGTLMTMHPAEDMASDDRLMTPLSRVWCIYELWRTLELRDPSHLHIQQEMLEPQHWHNIVMGLDIRECDSFNRHDYNLILGMVEEEEGGIERLNNDVRTLFSLQPLFFEGEVERLLEGASGIDLGPVLDALQSEASNVVWLQGVNGSGKSSVSAELIRKPGKWHVLSHLIKHDDTNTQNPSRAVATLAYQLYRLFPDVLGNHYTSYGPMDVYEMGGDDAIRKLLLEPLHKVGDAQVCILIDALDEGLNRAEVDFCESQAYPVVNKCQRNLILAMARKLGASLPPNVKLLVTSCIPEAGGPDAYLAEMLRGLSCHVVSVTECVSTMQAAERIMTAAPSAWQHSELMEAADGNLVYYKVLAEMLRAGSGTWRPERPPLSLGEAYSEYLESILMLEPPSSGSDTLLQLVQLLTSAREPPTAARLKEDHRFETRDLTAFGILFHLGKDSKVYALHRSVREFFSGRLWDQSGRSRRWMLDPAAGHRAFSEALLREIKQAAEKSTSPSVFCLRHAIYHASQALDGNLLLDWVAGVPELWEWCYEMGETQAVLDALQLSGRTPQMNDIARTLIANHAEFVRKPHMFLQRAYDTPRETYFSKLLRAQQRRPPGFRLLGKPTSWSPQIVCLQGHSGWVRGVALSADGVTAASGSEDCTVLVWDTRTGKAIAVLQGHEGAVNSVALSEDGGTVASGSHDCTVRVWDTRTGHQVGCSRSIVRGGELSHRVWSDALSQQMSLTAVAFAAAHGQVACLQGHGNAINSVALSADGTVMASASDDRTVCVWDAVSGTLRACLEGHTGWINTVALSKDGTMAATASADSTIRIWNAVEGVQVSCLKSHSQEVVSLALSGDGATLASTSWDCSIYLWGTKTGKQLGCLAGHTSVVSCVALSADGKTIASGSFDRTVRIWDTEEKTQVGSSLAPPPCCHPLIQLPCIYSSQAAAPFRSQTAPAHPPLCSPSSRHISLKPLQPCKSLPPPPQGAPYSLATFSSTPVPSGRSFAAHRNPSGGLPRGPHGFCPFRCYRRGRLHSDNRRSGPDSPRVGLGQGEGPREFRQRGFCCSQQGCPCRCPERRWLNCCHGLQG